MLTPLTVVVGLVAIAVGLVLHLARRKRDLREETSAQGA